MAAVLAMFAPFTGSPEALRSLVDKRVIVSGGDKKRSFLPGCRGPSCPSPCQKAWLPGLDAWGLWTHGGRCASLKDGNLLVAVPTPGEALRTIRD